MSEVKLPVEWAQQKKTPWKLACLAASVCGWDPQQEEGQIAEEEYMDGLRAATAKLEACRAEAGKLADSTSASRVCIIEHPSAMAAVVAHKPSVTEMMAAMAARQSSEDRSPMQRMEENAHMLWSRVLFPDAAGKAIIMNEYSLDYLGTYPTAFTEKMQISPVDVRKKHMR